MNLTRFHREHEKFYASLAARVRRHPAAARAHPPGARRPVVHDRGVHPVRLSPYEGAEDLNSPAALQLDGVLFLEGEGRPAEISPPRPRPAQRGRGPAGHRGVARHGDGGVVGVAAALVESRARRHARRAPPDHRQRLAGRHHDSVQSRLPGPGRRHPRARRLDPVGAARRPGRRAMAAGPALLRGRDDLATPPTCAASPPASSTTTNAGGGPSASVSARSWPPEVALTPKTAEASEMEDVEDAAMAPSRPNSRLGSRPTSSSTSATVTRHGPALRRAPTSRSNSNTPVSSHSRSVGSNRGRERARAATGNRASADSTARPSGPAPPQACRPASVPSASTLSPTLATCENFGVYRPGRCGQRNPGTGPQRPGDVPVMTISLSTTIVLLAVVGMQQVRGRRRISLAPCRARPWPRR